MADLRREKAKRPFSIIYNDFIDSEGIITANEKLICTILYRYGDTAFPSIRTLVKKSGLSKRTVQRTLDSLQQKKILFVEHRMDKNKGCQTNMYYLIDNEGFWKTGNEDDSEYSQMAKKKQLFELAKELNYELTEKKELGSAPTKDTESSPCDTNVCPDNKGKIRKSQDKDTQIATLRYEMDDLKSIFEYDAIMSYPGIDQKILDAVMSVLFDTLNSTKEEITFSKDDRKPAMLVIGKLMKLDLFDIMNVIHKYNSITEPIASPDRYLLTMLYKAKEQHNLETINLIKQHGY